MSTQADFPHDYQTCVDFHGHSCPGLAIGYVASTAAVELLGLNRSEDEEIVTVAENDSCAVDAVQVLLGCTFGKGNLIFKNWGKQVFTVFDRKTGRAVRLSFKGQVPFGDERRELRRLIAEGQAGEDDKQKFQSLGLRAVATMLNGSWQTYFDAQEVETDPPDNASVVKTADCAVCGEPVMITRLTDKEGKLVCKGCLDKER
jgi:formylmethanofuran dehydrogenase subunit E